MKNKPKQSFSLILALCFSLIYPSLVFAGVDLPWSTTYDCPEWVQDGSNPSCDGLVKGGDWKCSGSTGEQITSAANYSGGGGGRGQRHWKGDGDNNVSGGLRISFSSPQTELWVRWYMRYESGFHWLDNIIYTGKWLYFDIGQSDQVIPEFEMSYVKFSINGLRYAANSPSGSCSGKQFGWYEVMGNSYTSDGQWHCYEIHIKMDTNGSDGVCQMWVDGDQKFICNAVNYNTGSWDYFLIGSNSRYPDGGGCKAVDFDDIAVSNTGYIGLTYGVPPSPPKNPRIK